MNTPNTSGRRFAKTLRILAAMSVLAGLHAAGAAAEPEERPASEQAAAPAPALASKKLTTEELKVRENWRKSMAEHPLPKANGCFQSSYPNREWKEVGCTQAPPFPMPPRRGPRPEVIGNGDDISAQAPSGFISTATGSFTSVSGVTSVSSPIGNAGSSVNNAYTLQLNTNFFNSTACAGSPNAGCRGWEQFVYYNDGSSGLLFIQYWLLNYNTACPAGGWTQFSFTGSSDIYCYRNSNAVAVPNQPIANLAQLRLTGSVNAASDSISFDTGSHVYATTGVNAVAASAGWQIAEFNVFGAGGNSSGGGQATFNSGATLTPRALVVYGGTTAPTCVAQGFTGETNNLAFGPSAPAASTPGPAMIFTESSAGGAPSHCAAATSVGDTHLATFAGLFYDFQASGDFVLAEVDPGFVVQTRQVSGAPTWPNASVNHAIATQMGKTKVAICLGPMRLNIDGKNAELNDGMTLSLPDGTDIRRRGNVFLITGESGDSVRAEVFDKWINVSVGLGQWPAKVRGLIANANGNVNQIAARDGTVLTNPFRFEELYHHYADSWRVGAKESMLSVCGREDLRRGIPQKAFYAKNLPRKVQARAKAICLDAGVKAGALLDACILDVAVIGNEKAAQVFAGQHAPMVAHNAAVVGSDKHRQKRRTD